VELNNLKRNNMATQLIITIFFALAIIFIPYSIGCFIPIKEPNLIARWFIGVVSLVLIGFAIGILIFICKNLWVAAGHLLDNF